MPFIKTDLRWFSACISVLDHFFPTWWFSYMAASSCCYFTAGKEHRKLLGISTLAEWEAVHIRRILNPYNYLRIIKLSFLLRLHWALIYHKSIISRCCAVTAIYWLKFKKDKTQSAPTFGTKATVFVFILLCLSTRLTTRAKSLLLMSRRSIIFPVKTHFSQI